MDADDIVMREVLENRNFEVDFAQSTTSAVVPGNNFNGILSANQQIIFQMGEGCYTAS